MIECIVLLLVRGQTYPLVWPQKLKGEVTSRGMSKYGNCQIKFWQLSIKMTRQEVTKQEVKFIFLSYFGKK